MTPEPGLLGDYGIDLLWPDVTAATYDGFLILAHQAPKEPLSTSF
jgi:hypothetical protein